MRKRFFKSAAVLGCILILTFKTVSADEQSALTMMVRTVLENHPSVLAARSELDVTQARESAADQPLYNPELDVEYEGAGDISTKMLGISQAIDWGNKRKARTRVAALGRERMAAELEGMRQELAAELLNALADYHTKAELADLAEQRSSLMKRFLKLATQQQQAGDLGQVALDLARLAYTEAKLQRVRVVGAQVQAEQALKGLTDEPPGGWPVLPAIPSTLSLDLVNIDTLLEQLPVLRAARTQITRARAAVELSRRERKADPTIGLRGGREGAENLIGLNLSIPLFVRNSFNAEVDASNAQVIQREQSAHNIYRTSRSRLIVSVQRYELMRQAWNDWLQTGQTSLESQVQLLERLWRVGELSTADYLVQVKQTLDTRTAATELYGSLWQAWFQWLIASGQTESWLGLKE